MVKFTGALARQYRVDRAAPLGRGDPAAHMSAFQKIDRDDAPETTRIRTPEVLNNEDLTRSEWLALYSPPPVGDDEVRRPHTSGGPHTQGDNEDHNNTYGEYQKDGTFHRYGGHTPTEQNGSGGAAHGGIRRDNSSAWANPEGYRLGNDYQSTQANRRMPAGRFRGELRPIMDFLVETGSEPSPPEEMSRYTSTYDPTVPDRRFGPQRPTTRRVQRPNADGVSVDTEPGFDAPSYGIGGSFAL